MTKYAEIESERLEQQMEEMWALVAELGDLSNRLQIAADKVIEKMNEKE